MGINVNVSKPVDLNSNEFLKQFAGKTHIKPDSDFWDTFLKFTIYDGRSADEQLNVDSMLEPFLESFIQSNLTSGNFGSLVNVFQAQAKNLLALTDSER
jgi:dymeclin